MMVGIMILGMFISTLKSSFVETWVENKERRIKNQSTILENEKNKTTKNPISSVKDETK